MSVLGEILEIVGQLLFEGGADLIHRRYGALGCMVTLGVIALLVALLIWWFL